MLAGDRWPVAALILLLNVIARADSLSAQAAQRVMYVSALDQSGAPVPNLRPADLIIREDKATREIHEKLEGEQSGHDAGDGRATLASVVIQIGILDLVFSLDSVITAVGMADHVGVMVAAVVIAVGFMMLAAGSVASFCSTSLPDSAKPRSARIGTANSTGRIMPPTRFHTGLRTSHEYRPTAAWIHTTMTTASCWKA